MLAKRLFSLLATGVLLCGCSGPADQSAAEGKEDAASTGAEAGAAASGASDAVVFRNFTLIDGNDGDPSPASAMIVEDGRIVRVGPNADLPSPPGAEQVDLAGKFVAPGLIDLHVHLSVLENFGFNHEAFTPANIEDDLRTYASYGVTSIMTQGTDKDLVFPLVEEQRSGRPSLSRIFTGGQGIVFEGGYGGVPGINDPVATVEDAARVVARQSENGADLIKIWVDDEFGTMPAMPPEISQAAIDAAHEHGLRAVAHIFYLNDAKRLVEQGVDGFVHSVRDKPVDAALIESMKEKGTWQVSMTLSREAAMFAYGERAPFLDDPFFTRGVAQNALDRLASAEYQQQVSSGPHFAQYRGILGTAKSNAKALVSGGVNYAFGTDSGPSGRFPGYSAHWELQLLVEAGLTPAEALQSATRRAAEFLGADDLGTLEQGHWADFIVLDANPLDDIRNSRAISRVYIAGNPVEPVTR
jgi:imidazolonepropionase-like amidohydrolase